MNRIPRVFTSRRLASQRGAVLLISLIMLVLLTLAGIGLMRSVSISNVVAGNLAFQQAATHSADAGVEAAVAFLEANRAGPVLHSSILAGGVRYVAQRQEPAANVSWDSFWTSTIAGSGAVNTLPTDAAGNTVSYVIHRLCNTTGGPVYPGCSYAPDRASGLGNSQGGLAPVLQSERQIYYRITARVAGPRNTLSFVQVVVAI